VSWLIGQIFSVDIIHKSRLRNLALKLETSTYGVTLLCKKYFDILNSLCVTYQCDRQTDRQTDGRTDGRMDILLANAALRGQKWAD